MNNYPLVLPFADALCRDVSLTGGKGASLATMTQEGLPVPPGFVITSAAFESVIDQALLRKYCVNKDMQLARELVSTTQPPKDLVAAEYRKLKGLVAVRSSACAEDSEGASYAGQQETFLNVDGLESVYKYIVECWLSFFTDRAVFYRSEKGSLEDIAMAVVVQQMIDSKKAGVLFSVDPVHGRKDRMVIEAAFGLGENVVDGEHTPDNYTTDRKGNIKRSRIVDQQVLDETETTKLVEMAKYLEQLHGCPQDIEWAFDDQGDLYLLQSRPITTI